MKTLSRSAISCLVSFAVAYSPTYAHAKAVEKKPISKSEIFEIVRDPAIESAVLNYRGASTPERYLGYVPLNMSESDRTFLKKHLGGMAHLPKLTRQGNLLTFKQDDGTETTVKILNLEKNQFSVNGKLWTFDPRAPLKGQIEILSVNYFGQTSSWFEFFVPKAHANIAIIAGLVVLFVGAVAAFGVRSACYAFPDELGTTFTNLACPEIMEVIRREKMAGAGRFTALEDQKSADGKSNVLDKFVPIKEWRCPAKNEGKNRFYEATVRLVHNKNSEVRGIMEFSAEGKPLKLEMRTSDSKKFIAAGEFDAESYLKCLILENPDADKEVIGKLIPNDTKKYCRQFIKDFKPEQIELLQTLDDMTKAMHFWVARCSVEIAKEEKEKGRELGTPSQSVSDSEKTQEKPPENAPGSAQPGKK